MAFKPKTHLQTFIFVAKLASVSLLLVSLSLFTVKLAVPFTRSLLVYTLPSVVASLRTYLAPPYLFLAINLIILTIWKLSESTRPSKGPEPTPQIASLKPKQPTHQPKAPPPPVPLHVPETHVEEIPAPPVEEETALSMDATWRKITSGIRRAETFKERSSPAPALAPEIRRAETFRDVRPELLQMGDDELKREFEAFIKKVNDQMRLPSPAQQPLSEKPVHVELRRQRNPKWEY